MKKFRILALIMTCAILLSSIMIPVAATETPTPSFNYTATNVVGKDITIDGYATAEEGWSKNPTFTLSAHHETEVSGSADRDGWSVDDDPTEVRISYDEDFLYFYYETNNPSGYHEGADNGKNGKRVYVGIAPNDRGLIDDGNTNNGETIWLVMNFYEPADPNTAETVTWEGMSADGTIGTQAAQNLVSQLCWTMDSAKLSANASYAGYFGKQNTLVNFKVVYVYNP